ncbi:endoribonuclease Dicer-like protein, partial [Leptotrombidium deliense]
MKRLLELLSNYNPQTSSKKLCGVIFVKLRNECHILSQWLNEVAKFDEKKFGFLKVGYAVGVASAPDRVTSLVKQNMKKQEKVLSQFRGAELNLVIATSVLEEGIDVPHCNLVCRYNPATTYRDYVQSKGRARDPEADYVLFCEEGDKNTKERINYFREVDERLKAMCKDRGLYRAKEDECYNEPTSEVLISKSGARITLNMSIDVVHNFCAKLPSDSFGQLRPVDEYDIGADMLSNKLFQYTVQMPINSGVGKVVGPWNSKRMTAKKLAYLEVCRELYEKGRINDNFVPPKLEKLLKSYYEQLGLPIGYGDEKVEVVVVDEKNVKLIPGTRRRRQKYIKEIH